MQMMRRTQRIHFAWLILAFHILFRNFQLTQAHHQLRYHQALQLLQLPFRCHHRLLSILLSNLLPPLLVLDAAALNMIGLRAAIPLNSASQSLREEALHYLIVCKRFETRIISRVI